MRVARGAELRRSLEERLGLSAAGMLTLAAIVSLVVLVSLPRLHGFALVENERDAVATVRRLARELGALPAAQQPGATQATPSPPTIGALLARGGGPDLLHELPDAELLDGGRLLRRRGYLFRIERAGPPAGARVVRAAVAAEGEGAGAELVVVAWPWEARRTGTIVVAGSAAGELRAHPNGEGLWSGRERSAGMAELGAGWRRLR